MLNMQLYAKTNEEKAKQLNGIANLHISVAKELLAGEKPLTKNEMEALLDILATANEAKHLAQSLKKDVETKESA
ncbi:MAG: hypothetical protein C0602_12100 [Denitrovibrio sp.]|nr:MAG: hypothetical protein C0602_12100 [Denitrovibrio sp.]